MVKPLLDSAVAGLQQASSSFERSAAQVTRLTGAVSAAETAATVHLSPEARNAAPSPDSESNGSLEGVLVDTRVAKYQFIANLRVLQTGDEMSKELRQIGKK